MSPVPATPEYTVKGRRLPCTHLRALHFHTAAASNAALKAELNTRMPHSSGTVPLPQGAEPQHPSSTERRLEASGSAARPPSPNSRVREDFSLTGFIWHILWFHWASTRSTTSFASDRESAIKGSCLLFFLLMFFCIFYCKIKKHIRSLYGCRFALYVPFLKWLSTESWCF